jgi:hypothetical protein
VTELQIYTYDLTGGFLLRAKACQDTGPPLLWLYMYSRNLWMSLLIDEVFAKETIIFKQEDNKVRQEV